MHRLLTSGPVLAVAILLFIIGLVPQSFSQTATPQQSSSNQSSTPASNQQSPANVPATTPTPGSQTPIPPPTSEQLEQGTKEAGVSEQQLREMGIDPSNPQQALERARELGVPESQIQDYLSRYQSNEANMDTPQVDPFENLDPASDEQAGNGDQQQGETEEKADEETKDLLEDETEQDTDSEKSTNDDQLEPSPGEFEGTGRFRGLTYIGYRTLFEGQGNLGSLSVGPIDPGYLISRGDVLRVYVWGEQQFQYEFTVSENGNITVPNVGPIFLSGTRYDNLQNKLIKSFSRFYSTLTTSPPRSFLEVSIAQPRSKNVYLMGNVRTPRTYSVSSYATVFNLLYATGGPPVQGSLRDVRVIRDNKVFASVDLYASLVKGKDVEDIRLWENDLVFVPPRGKSVAIGGPVLHPGIYEMKKGETLLDLIQFAGSPAPTSYTFRAQIDRIVPFEERTKVGDDRRLIDVNLADVLSGKKVVKLEDGDRITLFPYNDILTQFVTINGLGVLRPGVYQLGDIKRVKDLVLAADSLTGDAYLGKADIRRMQPNGTELFLSIDLLKAMQGDPADNLVLLPQDQVRIYSTSDWRPEKTVQLLGYVREPGTYPFAENQTLYDLMFAHAGLQDSVRLGSTVMNRADLLRRQVNGKLFKIVEFNPMDVWNKVPDANKSLQPGDRVVMYEKNRFQPEPRIILEGHVKRPGTYTYLDNLTIGDLVYLHSGFEDSVFFARAYQQRLDIFRLNDDGRTLRTISLPLLEVWAGGDAASYPLLPEDRIQIYSQRTIEIEEHSVTLAGEINSPGSYRLRKNMTMADLLLMGGGFTQDAWLFEAELTRYNMVDLPGDSIAITRRIPLSLDADSTMRPDEIARRVIEESEHLSTFFLQPMDRVTILKNPEYHAPRFVEIEGEVNFPGRFSLVTLDEHVSDIVRRAGGVSSIASVRGAQLFRDGKRINIDFYELLEKRNKKEDIVVLPGDRIVIPTEPGTVSVEGLVYNPGLYKYYSGKRVKDYIRESGGTLEDAGEIFVRYASGRSLKVDFWHNPRVYDGSVIEVREKAPEPDAEKGEPLDITEVTKETLTLLTSALTIIVLATRIN
ncbi:SLBB domain-containing protein [bacterium]|nr:SLBB domain-containing protein [bacterium]